MHMFELYFKLLPQSGEYLFAHSGRPVKIIQCNAFL